MATNEGNDEAKGEVASACAAWKTLPPTRPDYAAVVTLMNANKLVGEASVFERGPHVPVTHMGYFRPPTDAFQVELKSKDRRSAKEWEYVNSAGVWVETGLAALEVAREQGGGPEEFGRRLALAEESFKAALEVLSMRAQYFHDITEHGIEEARQMAFLVEQGHDAVHSSSYRSAREALTTKLEVEAAKQLAKARLEKAGKRKKKGGGQKEAADSE